MNRGLRTHGPITIEISSIHLAERAGILSAICAYHAPNSSEESAIDWKNCIPAEQSVSALLRPINYVQ